MFDERQHPLDDSKAWLETPEDDDVVDFLRTIQQALHLEMSCIVTALILLERGMLRAKLRLSPSTWRPLLIVAIAIASKVVLDEKVFLGDYCELLPSLSLLGLRALTEARRRRPQRAAALCRPRPAPEIAPLPSPPQLEAVFLSLINYSTVIGRKQFAKYYYALLDVAPPSPGAPTCSFKRRAAATLGYGP